MYAGARPPAGRSGRTYLGSCPMAIRCNVCSMFLNSFSGYFGDFPESRLTRDDRSNARNEGPSWSDFRETWLGRSELVEGVERGVDGVGGGCRARCSTRTWRQLAFSTTYASINSKHTLLEVHTCRSVIRLFKTIGRKRYILHAGVQRHRQRLNEISSTYRSLRDYLMNRSRLAVVVFAVEVGTER